MKCITLSLFLSLMVLDHVRSHSFSCDNPIRTDKGFIRGSETLDINQQPFCAHRGIRYAKAPVGELRFKAPQSPDHWDGVFNATTDSVRCPQGSNFDEDCLKLNVYSFVAEPNSKLLPVFCLIHGGGFRVGSAAMTSFDPRRIMSHKRFIMVAIQYRLGVLGFLSTENEDAPGNYGLLDQRLALQWIQKNIHLFGGDPKRVTIGGGSAGGMSVGFQLISEKSYGLCDAAIIMSGSPLMSPALMRTPRIMANLLAQHANCPYDNSTSMVACLRQIGTPVLIEGYHKVQAVSRKSHPFLPVVEPKEICNFMCEDPFESFRQGKFNHVPIMAGTTLDETAGQVLSLPVFQMIQTLTVVTDDIIAYLFGVAFPDIFIQYTDYTTNLDKLSLAVKQEYSNECNYSDPKQMLDFIINMTTHLVYDAPNDLLVRVLADNGHLPYLYSFDYHGDLSDIIAFGSKKVDHAENGAYLALPFLTARDTAMANLLIQHLADFTDFLNPTPWFWKPGYSKWWPTINFTQLWYMKYGDEESRLSLDYFTRRMLFWNYYAPKIVSGEITFP